MLHSPKTNLWPQQSLKWHVKVKQRCSQKGMIRVVPKSDGIAQAIARVKQRRPVVGTMHAGPVNATLAKSATVSLARSMVVLQASIVCLRVQSFFQSISGSIAWRNTAVVARSAQAEPHCSC